MHKKYFWISAALACALFAPCAGLSAAADFDKIREKLDANSAREQVEACDELGEAGSAPGAEQDAARSEELLTAAARHKNPLVRSAAARNLGLVRLSASAAALSVLVRDREYAVRREAVQALAVLKMPEAAAPLIDAIDGPDKDANPQLRLLAIQALGWLEESGSAPGGLALAGLVRAMGDSDARNRLEAVNLIGALGGEQVIASLSQKLEDPAQDVRLAVVYALGTVGGTQATRALLDALINSFMQVRIAACEILAAMEDPKAVPALSSAVRTRQELAVRVAAAKALGRIGDRKGLPALQEFLREAEAQKPQVEQAISQIVNRRMAGTQRGRITGLEAEIARMQVKLGESENRIAELGSERNRIARDVETAQLHSSWLRSERDQLRKQVDSLKTEISSLQSQLQAAKKSAAQAAAQRKSSKRRGKPGSSADSRRSEGVASSTSTQPRGQPPAQQQ